MARKRVLVSVEGPGRSLSTVSSKSRGVLGPALWRRQDGEMSISWSIKKDVIWLRAIQNRRTFRKVWDSKTKT